MNTIFEDYYVHYYLGNANDDSGRQKAAKLESYLFSPMKLLKKKELKESK